MGRNIKIFESPRCSINMSDNTPEVIAAVQKAAIRGLVAVGMTCRAHAMENIQQNHFVDTEELLRGIEYQVDEGEMSVYVGTNVQHGVYVELGTGIYYPGGRRIPWHYMDKRGNWHTTTGQPPKAFLKPAAADHLEEYRALIEDSVKNA